MNLTSQLLSEHWQNIGQEVISLKGNERLLNVTPQLFTESDRSALPIIFLTNMTEDTAMVLNILEEENYTLEVRASVIQRQIAYLKVLGKHSSQGNLLN